MLILFRLGAKFVAIYLGVKFGLEDLLRVKVLTFRNSGGKIPLILASPAALLAAQCTRQSWKQFTEHF